MNPWVVSVIVVAAVIEHGEPPAPPPTLFEALETGDSPAPRRRSEHAASAAFVPRPGAGTIEDRPGVATPLATVLARAGAYVLGYEDAFKDVVAEESYRQWSPGLRSAAGPLGNGGFAVRNLRSDLVFVRLPGALPWGTFRDVYEVDGRRVRDRERRIEKLFSSGAPTWEQAEAILKESSRYNLGRAYRNVNTPTLALQYLRPEHQGRMLFRRRGTRWLAGFETVEVEFDERASPALVHDSFGNDVPAKGRVFIEPSRGTVLRTEIEYDLEPDKVRRRPEDWERAVVTTAYRLEKTLALWVPERMDELYRFMDVGRVEATARYTNYRRFGVDVAWAAAGTVAPPTEGAAAAGEWLDLPAQPPAALPEPAVDLSPSRGGASSAAQPLEMVEAPALPGEVATLLRAAGEYVLRYEEEFRNIGAEELYEQSEEPEDPGSRRLPSKLRSEVTFALLPGPVPWLMLRDVLEADGRTVRQHGRLAELFQQSPGTAVAIGAALSREAERLIVARVPRTLNVAVAPLAYLHPDNRDAFTWKRRPAEKLAGFVVVPLDFVEVARPTLNQDGAGNDVAVRGRFWLRENDGALLKYETLLDLDGVVRTSHSGGSRADARASMARAVTNRAWMKVEAAFRDDAGIGLPAPVEMKEEIGWTSSSAELISASGPACSKAWRSHLTGQVFQPTFSRGSIQGRARYSGFRRLVPPRHTDSATGHSVAVPPGPTRE